MSHFLWDIPAVKGRKQHFNPKPLVPETGWKRPTGFPRLKGADVIVLDFESKDPNLAETGPGWGRKDPDSHPIGLAVGTDDGFSAYYPFAHEEQQHDNFRKADVLDWIAPYVTNPHLMKMFWNGGYDLGWFLEEGIKIQGPIYDGWVAEKLIRYRNPATLEAAGQRHVGKGKRSTELLRWIHQYVGRGLLPNDDDLDDKLKKYLYLTPPCLCGPYAESDVTLPLEVAAVQQEILEKLGLTDLFYMECDLIPLFTQIRFEGVSVDKRAAELAEHETGIEIRTLQSEVDCLAGKHIAVTERDKLGQVLSDRGHKVPRTEKTNKFSVKEEFLKKLDDPLAKKVIELAELTKFRSSFIQSAVLGSERNGRIHGTLKPFGTITGRLSAEMPNLQQIPSKNKRLMEMIRSIFIPDTGHSHWEKYDYSQLQCRILAHFATGRGAEELRAEYNANPNTNYHNFTHDMILDKAGVDLPHKRVKGCNFSLIFGSGKNKTASLIGLPKEEIDSFFDSYHGALPYVQDTMDSISRETSMRGYSLTVLNRRVDFDMWQPRHYRVEGEFSALPFDQAIKKWGQNIERAYLYKSCNYKIQGTEADLVKMALWKCMKSGVFDVTGIPKLLVHDEWDHSARDDSEATRTAFRELRHTMETAIQFKVPIITAREVGTSWGTSKEVA